MPTHRIPDFPEPRPERPAGVNFLPLDVSGLVAMIRSAPAPVPPVATFGQSGPSLAARPAHDRGEDPERWDGLS